MHREIQKDKDYIFTLKKYSNNIQLVPTAATVTIEDNQGSTVVSETAASIDAEGTITYTFLAAANDTDDVNFKITWKWTYSSKNYYESELFDVVLYPLINPVTDEDLILFVKELRRDIYEQKSKTTATGTTSTIIDTALKVDPRKDWVGGRIKIFVDTVSEHEGQITAFAKSTGTVTFQPVYTTNVPTGLNYVIRSSYNNIITEARNNHVHRDVRNKVELTSGYIDSNVIRNMIIYKALEIICFSKVEIVDDKWDIRAKKFKEEYETEFEKLYEPYDSDRDGDISDEEDTERPNFSNVRIEI